MKKFILFPLLLISFVVYAASTFTPNLNLEKQPDGASNWGTVIRLNYDILDTSIGEQHNVSGVHLAVSPDVTSIRDIGTSSSKFRNLFLSGTANVDTLIANTTIISGGTLDNTIIGSITPLAGTFTTLTGTDIITTTLNATGGGALTGTWTDLGNITTIDINGGTIDGTDIGNTVKGDALFTVVTIDTADINSGTIDGITSFTAANDLDIGSFVFRASNFIADSLPSGRVIFTTTNGELSSDSDLTFSTATLLATNLTSSNQIQAGTLTDGTLIIQSGEITSATSIISNTLSDGTLLIQGGSIDSAVDITASGQISAGTLTDGTLLIQSGEITSATSIVSNTLSDGTLLIQGGAITNATSIIANTLSDGTLLIQDGFITSAENITSGTLTSTDLIVQSNIIDLSDTTEDFVFTFNASTGVWSGEAGSGAPGGNDTEIQFNDSGSFNGDTSFTIAKASNIVTVGTLSDGTLQITGGNITSVNNMGIGGTLTSSGVILGANGTKDNPTYSFSGDSNSGMYSIADNELGFATNGNKLMNITANTFIVFANMNPGSAGDKNLGSTGDFWNVVNAKDFTDRSGVFLSDKNKSYNLFKNLKGEQGIGYCRKLEAKGKARLKFSEMKTVDPELIDLALEIASEDIIFDENTIIDNQVDYEEFTIGQKIATKGQSTRWRIKEKANKSDDGKQHIIQTAEGLSLTTFMSHMSGAIRKLIDKIEDLESRIQTLENYH